MDTTIGANTGRFYRAGILSLREQEKILLDSGASVVEIFLKEERIPSVLGGENFKKFSRVSVHLPGTHKNLLNKIELYKEIVERQNAKYLIIHPDEIDEESWRALADSNLPICIENMDSRKKNGFDIEELRKLMRTYDFGFVLDLQHVFEHDETMEYGWELFKMSEDRLKEIHVSGQTKDNIHAFVHQADNKKKIIDFAKRLLSEKQVPVIIEGFSSNVEDLKTEIDFLRKELCD